MTYKHILKIKWRTCVPYVTICPLILKRHIYTFYISVQSKIKQHINHVGSCTAYRTSRAFFKGSGAAPWQIACLRSTNCYWNMTNNAIAAAHLRMCATKGTLAREQAPTKSSKNFASTTGEQTRIVVIDGGFLKEVLGNRHCMYKFAAARQSMLTHTCTHVGTMRFCSPVGCCNA